MQWGIYSVFEDHWGCEGSVLEVIKVVGLPLVWVSAVFVWGVCTRGWCGLNNLICCFIVIYVG